METDVFENEDFAVAQGFALAFNAWADAVESERHGITEKLFQLFRGRLQGIFQIGTALGAAQVRSKHEPSAFLNRKTQCRKCFADPGVVGHDAIFERDVEVHTDEDALSAEVEFVDGELVHR